MGYNTLDVKFSFSGVPPRKTDEYKTLKKSIDTVRRMIQRSIDGESSESFDFDNKSYDKCLLRHYLTSFDDLIKYNDDSECSFTEKTPANLIDYSLYADVAKYCENTNLTVTVSLYGPHVECVDDIFDAGYYNNIETIYENGCRMQQVVSHCEEDGSSFSDDMVFVFSESECKDKLSDFSADIQSKLDEQLQQIEEHKNERENKSLAIDSENNEQQSIHDLEY